MHPIRHIAFTNELRFARPREEVFEAFSRPRSGSRSATARIACRVVNDRRVGGQIYEDWGEGTGKLYGTIGWWDPPAGYSQTSQMLGGGITLEPPVRVRRGRRRPSCGTRLARSARSRTRWPRGSRPTARSRRSRRSCAPGSSGRGDSRARDLVTGQANGPAAPKRPFAWQHPRRRTPKVEGFLALLAARRAAEDGRGDTAETCAPSATGSGGPPSKASNRGPRALARRAPRRPASRRRRSRAGWRQSARSSGTSSCSARAPTAPPPRSSCRAGARRLPRTLSPAEAERLIEAAAGTTPRTMRDRALVELLYGAGLRVSEAVGLEQGRRRPRRAHRPLHRQGRQGARRAGRAPRGRGAPPLPGARPPYLDRRHRPELFLNAQGGALTRRARS